MADAPNGTHGTEGWVNRMAEYIEREKYLRWSDISDALIEHHGEQVMSKYLTVAECKAAKFGIEGALYVLEYLPAADVAPVRHGRWVDKLVRDWHCSECGKKVPRQVYFDGYCYADKLNYCPNCGARMDGE